MTPAETIQAAIDLLEEQRREASPGPWIAWRKQQPGFYPRSFMFGVEDARATDITGRTSVADATLIHTLHATIDAQLAFLRRALTYEALYGFAPEDMALARAILGEQVDA